jgi:signal transduction histidine kinase
MEMRAEARAGHTDVGALLEQLIEELSPVLDAHGVCAGAAQIIAAGAGGAAAVAIVDTTRSHLDIWKVDATGEMKQDRWSSEKASLPAERLGAELMGVGAVEVISSTLRHPSEENDLLPIGIVCLADPSGECPIKADDLGLISSQLTLLLDRAVLRQRSDQQAVEFGIISDISYSITATLDLEEIFLQVSDAVRRAIGAESISVGMIDMISNEVVFVDALMGPLFGNMPQVRLKLGEGIAGWVALHGEPAIVNDAYSDQRFYSKIDRDTGFRTHSLLCVPLRVEQRVIGVLEAINKLNGRFDDNDSRLLQAISGPLAVAIENARLHSDVLAEKRRIETIFAGMSEGLLTADREGVVTAANDALLALLDSASDQVVGQPMSDVVRTRPAAFSDFVERVLDAADGFPQLACDLRQKKGQQFVPVLISGTAIDRGEELIFVFSDLSQIREVERMRDDFFNNIVHELRTPLATILMYARLLREGRAADNTQKANRFLGVIERESDRLQKLVRQMLQLAKMEARDTQKSADVTALKPILEQILPTFADQAIEKGITFKQHIASDLPKVVCSEDTLYLIFRNLVENSIKFTFSGTISVEAYLSDGVVRVDISDEGIGIPKEAVPNLFRRFYRAQTAVERGIAGTGLGLYMVKEALENNGGQIMVSSEEGVGTTFSVMLPAARD